MKGKTSPDIRKKPTPNHLLKEQRKQHFLTQSQLAEKIGTTVVNVNRWESGVTFPGLYFRQKLCELFLKTPEELGLVPEIARQMQAAAVSSPSFPDIWNVPFQRNPYFTGREDVLKRLYNVLKGGEVAAVVQTQAITGLGGIGKTQTAVEYAYRHRSNYRDILWVKADSREILASDFVILASVLDLPEKSERDQGIVINAVKRWLKEHTRWLLVLDNVEDIHTISDFVPATDQGHILLTTRLQSTGDVAQRIEVEKMEPGEGALFLLRRAKLIAPDESLDDASQADREKAIELSQLMDGLPLALDQAAAYIEETGCGLTGYLKRYQTRRDALLKKRGRDSAGHPESVSTTLSISFEKVERANPAAADLLRLCTFLYPDAIPEEIITEGAPHLGPTLQPVAADQIELDDAISELRRYSLLRRDGDNQTLTIHRLVQEVIKESMDEGTQREWAERTVRAVNRAFPEVEFATEQRCQRCLSHAQACAELITLWNIKFAEAVRLLDQVGLYLQERGQYFQAESFLQHSLRIREQALLSNDLDIALGLNNLAKLYWAQGKFPQAESFHKQALDIRVKVLGTNHRDVAQSLNNLALLYDDQGKYDQAEPLYQQSLAICENILGPDHPDVARNLNNLAWLYFNQGKYDQAEPLYERSQAILEKTEGVESPKVAYLLSNRAGIYVAQGKYIQAEPLLIEALAICEKSLGSDHPHTGTVLNNLAELYSEQGLYNQAEPFYQKALIARRQALGPVHPYVAESLISLAILYYNQNRYDEAESLYQQSLTIYEQAKVLEHPNMATLLENYALLLRKTDREEEAKALETRARTIREKHAQENLS